MSPYLFDATELQNRHLVVAERSSPLSGLVPRLATGTQPIDDGNYIFSMEEREDFIALEPEARKLLRPFPGGVEYINGLERWILCFDGTTPSNLRAMPLVVERLRRVKEFRRKSSRKSTLAIADYPEKYNVAVIPKQSFLAIPEVSSSRREYVPIGWLSPPTIPSNKLRIIEKADTWHFGILASRMHMAWTRMIGGLLKSDFQYSVGINYNPFPWPEADEKSRANVRVLAQAILDARESHPNSVLADLYDPDTMPADLRKVHAALDGAVDRLYRKDPFLNDRERVEHLFRMYEQLVAPMLAAVAAPQQKGRAARRKAVRQN